MSSRKNPTNPQRWPPRRGMIDPSPVWRRDPEAKENQVSLPIVSRVMAKAATAERRALFAGLQAAVVTITDMYYAVDRPHGPEFDTFLERIEEALDVGGPYGSPEWEAHNARKISLPGDGLGGATRSADPPRPTNSEAGR